MLFFRKKREELPESQDNNFPELEELKQSFEKIKAELAAKAAVNQIDNPPVPHGHTLPELPEVQEMPAMSAKPVQEIPSLPEFPELPELPEEEEPEQKLKIKAKTVKPKPAKPLKFAKVAKSAKPAKPARSLFIRVDRFKEILASAKVIEEKIEGIETIMQNLREIRNRENEIMEHWKKEIQELKARLETIEKTLADVQ